MCWLKVLVHIVNVWLYGHLRQHCIESRAQNWRKPGTSSLHCGLYVNFTLQNHSCVRSTHPAIGATGSMVLLAKRIGNDVSLLDGGREPISIRTL